MFTALRSPAWPQIALPNHQHRGRFGHSLLYVCNVLVHRQFAGEDNPFPHQRAGAVSCAGNALGAAADLHTPRLPLQQFGDAQAGFRHRPLDDQAARARVFQRIMMLEANAQLAGDHFQPQAVLRDVRPCGKGDMGAVSPSTRQGGKLVIVACQAQRGAVKV